MAGHQLPADYVQLRPDGAVTRRLRIGVALLVLLVLAGLTGRRVPVWSSDASLWAETLRQLPSNPRALIDAQIHLPPDASRTDLICDRLQWLADSGGLTHEETWFTARLCLR